MSKRRRKRKRKARNLDQAMHQAEEMLYNPEALNDPRIQELLLKASLTKNTKEALEIHLALDKIIMGEYSILESPERRQELYSSRAGAAARDKAEEAFSQDQAAFVEDVFTRTDSLKATGARAEKIKANAMKMYKAAKDGKLGTRKEKELRFDWEIQHGAVRDVNASGHWVQQGSAPNIQNVLKPDVVRIMHRTYVFKPGMNENVPEVFARQYDLLMRGREETAERESVMNADQAKTHEAGAMEMKLMEIDKRYGVKRQLLGGNA